MSYSSKVKSEIIRDIDLDEASFEALLSAVMKVSGAITLLNGGKMGFKITTENPSTARFLYKNIKEKLGMRSEIMVRRGTSLKKNNIYIISFKEVTNIKEFLIRTSILENDQGNAIINNSVPKTVMRNDDLKRAYLKGAFLGSGSISNPEKQYHLEFVCRSEQYAQQLKKLLDTYTMKAKVVVRAGAFIVYLKDAESIIDLLNVIGAHNALLEIENIRIIKNMRNNVNRLVNCETANLTKTVNAAVRQVEAIKKIEKEYGFARLPLQLREIARLRLDYPAVSLVELGEMLDPPIGKSGVNHRLRKIEKIAQEIEN